MTGTILPPEKTLIIRNIAKSAAVIFALMQIEMMFPGRAATVMEIAGILAVDTRTVERHLTRLSVVNLVTSQGDRWLLTPNGMRTLFGGNPQPSLLSIEEPDLPLLEGEISAQIVHHDMNDDEAKNVLTDSSSSSINDCTNCAKTEQILKATASLFGDTVFVTQGMTSLEPEFVLGWVAKAYADRSRLNNPLGLLYRRLNAMEKLPVMYQRDPAKGLPAEFLREIGMVEEAERVESKESRQPEKVSWEDELKRLNTPVEYSYPEIHEVDGFGRNKRWVEVIGDEKWERHAHNKEFRGVAFAGNEPVRFDGGVMMVFVTHHGDSGSDHVGLANAWYAQIASEIYADQCGDPSARVEFVCEVK